MPEQSPLDSGQRANRAMSTPDIAGFRANPRPGRKRRNLPTEAWRERILQAARVVFGDEGYDGASMEDIAALAGLSRAATWARCPKPFGHLRQPRSTRLTALAHTLAVTGRGRY